MSNPENGEDPEDPSKSFVPGLGLVPSGPRGQTSRSGSRNSSFEFPGDPFDFKREPREITSYFPSIYSRRSDSERSQGSAQRQTPFYGYRQRQTSIRSRSRSPVRSQSESPLFISEGEMNDDDDAAANDDENDEMNENDDAGGSLSLDLSEVPHPESTPDEAETDCICPISLSCPARQDNLIDCRTLVVEKQWWIERMEKTVRSIESAARVLGLSDYALLVDVQPIVQYLARLLHQPPPSHQTRRQIYHGIQDWVNRISTLSLNTTVLQSVKSTNILRDIQSFLDGQFQGFRRQTHFPIILEEELTMLSNKWDRNDGNTDPCRGLLRVGSKLKVDPTYPYRRQANVYGHNGLVNGQRWDLRVQMKRDGAHSDMIAGICGNLVGGAYAVVMGYHNKNENQYYADIDIPDPITGVLNPNRVYYIGTSLKRQDNDEEDTNVRDVGDEVAEGEATLKTRMLKASLKSGNPIRLFRSANQSPKCAKKTRHQVRQVPLRRPLQSHELPLPKKAQTDLPLPNGPSPRAKSNSGSLNREKRHMN